MKTLQNVKQFERIADDAFEFSEELIAKSKVVGEELKETYLRISDRLSI
jgi:hypothetical protein